MITCEIKLQAHTIIVWFNIKIIGSSWWVRNELIVEKQQWKKMMSFIYNSFFSSILSSLLHFSIVVQTTSSSYSPVNLGVLCTKIHPLIVVHVFVLNFRLNNYYNYMQWLVFFPKLFVFYSFGFWMAISYFLFDNFIFTAIV